MSAPISRSLVRFAGNLASVLFALTAVLQLLLAAGILPVTMAWGGQQEFLTIGLRVASVAAAALLVFFSYVIRRRAGLSDGSPPSRTIRVLSWVITGFLLLNTLGNFASESPGERLLFGPISLLLATACLLVSLSESKP